MDTTPLETNLSLNQQEAESESNTGPTQQPNPSMHNLEHPKIESVSSMQTNFSTQPHQSLQNQSDLENSQKQSSSVPESPKLQNNELPYQPPQQQQLHEQQIQESQQCQQPLQQTSSQLPLPQQPLQQPPQQQILIQENAKIQGQSEFQQSISQTPPPGQNKTITKVKLMDEINLFEWLKVDVLNQIAEKAKSSVDQLITTLDPGMKEYLYTGGKIHVMVICENKNRVRPIREIFQTIFGRATVLNVAINEIECANGLEEGILYARRQISKLRENTNTIPQNQVVVAIQPTIVKLNDSVSSTMPTQYLTYCMLLEDPVLSLTLNSFSQFLSYQDYSNQLDKYNSPNTSNTNCEGDIEDESDECNHINNLITNLSIQIAMMYKGQLKESVA